MSLVMSSREFNQNTARAKREAVNGPVYIAERGEAKFVLLSIEDFRRIESPKRSIVDMLAMEGGEDIEFELPPRLIEPDRPLDLED